VWVKAHRGFKSHRYRVVVGSNDGHRFEFESVQQILYSDVIDGDLLERFLFVKPLTKRARAQLDAALVNFTVLRATKEYLCAKEVADMGAGLGILALLMALDGKSVVAVEPDTSDFSLNPLGREEIVANFRETIGGYWRTIEKVHGRVADVRHREFDLVNCFMVLEHVADYEEMIRECSLILRKGGLFVAICPNYLIPYEPHFSFPTLFAKAPSEFLVKKFGKGLFSEDADSFWENLSWPNPFRLKRALRGCSGRHEFSKSASLAWFEYYSENRPRGVPILKAGIYALSPWLSHVVRFLPTFLAPIIQINLIEDSLRPSDRN
jgi:2-polyprenyl-3-methyl-5-hydroxy-6-metoxy-1,4-benzoquinol methylase